MTNFQFYLNSPLQGWSILGPADGFFLKPFSAFYLLFIRLQLRQVWFFWGLWGHSAARCIGASRLCCPVLALEVSPSLRGLFFLC